MIHFGCKKKQSLPKLLLWAQLDLNQRPPDYESGATNQLSYGPNPLFLGLQV
jgi:hypothetical protein